jgi:hypothetical protein
VIDPEKLARGIELFNAQEFFAAHEELEDVWRETPGDERRPMQGLVQVAVAFHHHSTGNLTGASSVLERAARNLSTGEHLHGIELEPLRESLRQWREALASGVATPEYPKLARR